MQQWLRHCDWFQPIHSLPLWNMHWKWTVIKCGSYDMSIWAKGCQNSGAEIINFTWEPPEAFKRRQHLHDSSKQLLSYLLSIMERTLGVESEKLTFLLCGMSLIYISVC